MTALDISAPRMARVEANLARTGLTARTVVASLALFALVSGFLVQRHLDDTRERAVGAARERVEAGGDLDDLCRHVARSRSPCQSEPGRPVHTHRFSVFNSVQTSGVSHVLAAHSPS